MYFQHNILLHATAHIIDEFIPKPFLMVRGIPEGTALTNLIINFPHIMVLLIINI